MDGWNSLKSGGPNMNTLVSLEALASFGMSTAAVMLPKLGWPTFFEEPVMLLAFVLLGSGGRGIEPSSGRRASCSVCSTCFPRPRGSCRKGVDEVKEGGEYYRTVPTAVIRPEDTILVLPGDTSRWTASW